VTRSLRFRLPALFLLGIVLAAVVATLIAISEAMRPRLVMRWRRLTRPARA
jgi:hypothetical protein